MIAIPVAAFMGSVAMIVGPAPQTWCNHFGHGRPMIAIPTADDCGSLQLPAGIPGSARAAAARLLLSVFLGDSAGDAPSGNQEPIARTNSGVISRSQVWVDVRRSIAP